MDREVVRYTDTHTHIYTHTPWNTKPSKNEILPFAIMWMELEGIMLSKISQSEKGNYHISHSYVEFK